jgi:hypothetical protein
MGNAVTQTQDTKIMQKVNAVSREAFLLRYPSQVEHCLRLTMERLQCLLDKRGDVEPGDITTWKATPSELESLTNAAFLLNEIHLSFK